jgi:hypothetical protein
VNVELPAVAWLSVVFDDGHDIDTDPAADEAHNRGTQTTGRLHEKQHALLNWFAALPMKIRMRAVRTRVCIFSRSIMETHLGFWHYWRTAGIVSPRPLARAIQGIRME